MRILVRIINVNVDSDSDGYSIHIFRLWVYIRVFISV